MHPKLRRGRFGGVATRIGISSHMGNKIETISFGLQCLPSRIVDMLSGRYLAADPLSSSAGLASYAEETKIFLLAHSLQALNSPLVGNRVLLH